MVMSADDVLHVLVSLDAAGVRAWVDGGWGIDALVGEQTREHDDLDLVIDIAQVETAIATLATHGFSMHHDGRPTSFVVRDPTDRRVDLHPIRMDAAGGGYQAQPDGSDFYYDPEGLSGVGHIAGQPVACLSVALQLRCHEGYELDENDHHDLRILNEWLAVQ